MNLLGCSGGESSLGKVPVLLKLARMIWGGLLAGYGG
ncbi:hypothetical protein SPLC1_S202640 [Arthrospira platensis C1]|nr:hypothetical protein SPLC1_S202640 [Arthrospira platensis C1]